MAKTKKQKAEEQLEEVIVGSITLLPKITPEMTAADIKKLIEDDYRERIQKKLKEKFPNSEGLGD